METAKSFTHSRTYSTELFILQGMGAPTILLSNFSAHTYQLTPSILAGFCSLAFCVRAGNADDLKLYVCFWSLSFRFCVFYTGTSILFTYSLTYLFIFEKSHCLGIKSPSWNWMKFITTTNIGENTESHHVHDPAHVSPEGPEKEKMQGPGFQPYLYILTAAHWLPLPMIWGKQIIFWLGSRWSFQLRS